MERGKLILLEADLLAQQQRIENVNHRLVARKKASARDPIALESVGIQLHVLYVAFEDLFRLVAMHFESRLSTQRACAKNFCGA